MKLAVLSDISKLFRLSPSDALKKIFEVAIRYIGKKRKRKKDNRICTFETKPEWFSHIPYSIFNTPANSWLQNNKKEFTNLADRYCRHEFNLLGSGWVKVYCGMKAKGIEGISFSPAELSEPEINDKNIDQSASIASYLPIGYSKIDWQIDFISGFRWSEKTWYKDIQYGNIPGPDIKIPWELGRMQHLYIIAYAAIITKDDKYKNEIMHQVFDFISSNPPRFGTQWTSTMEVAIRLSNWLYVYDLLKHNNISIHKEFENIFLDSIHQHLDHIRNNMERSAGMKANHYFANIAGLLFAAGYLPENEETLYLLDFCINEIIQETFLQFNDDGTNFEASTYYHVLLTEMLLWSLKVIDSLPSEKLISLSMLKTKRYYKIDIEFMKIILPDEFINRINKIITFIDDISLANKDIFRFGDDDGGYFLANYYKQFDLINHKDSAYNIEHIKQLSNSISFINENDDKENNKLIEYKDFGLFGIENAVYKILIRCGNIGQNGKGGHSHNDQLSFCLSAFSHDIITDPGTYLYTPLHNKRNEFRSVKKHNTLTINNLEQNFWDTNSKDDLFWIIKDKTKSEVMEFNNKLFSGRHFAYDTEHLRTIEFKNNKIIGKDVCKIDEEKAIRFHLHPDTKCIQKETYIEVRKESTKLLFRSDQRLDIESYDYSPTYGTIIKANEILITSSNNEINWEIEILTDNI